MKFRRIACNNNADAGIALTVNDGLIPDAVTLGQWMMTG